MAQFLKNAFCNRFCYSPFVLIACNVKVLPFVSAGKYRTQLQLKSGQVLAVLGFPTCRTCCLTIPWRGWLGFSGICREPIKNDCNCWFKHGFPADFPIKPGDIDLWGSTSGPMLIPTEKQLKPPTSHESAGGWLPVLGYWVIGWWLLVTWIRPVLMLNDV